MIAIRMSSEMVKSFGVQKICDPWKISHPWFSHDCFGIFEYAETEEIVAQNDTFVLWDQPGCAYRLPTVGELFADGIVIGHTVAPIRHGVPVATVVKNGKRFHVTAEGRDVGCW